MMTEPVERPEIVTDDMLVYLDMVRETGAINMFGAAPWVADTFGISKQEARIVLKYWMDTFSERTQAVSA